MINKISGPNQINNLQNAKSVIASNRTKVNSDEISISAEAKEMADASFLNAVAEKTPGVRTELVEQIKLKIQDPNYLNATTIAATVDQVMRAYGI